MDRGVPRHASLRRRRRAARHGVQSGAGPRRARKLRRATALHDAEVPRHGAGAAGQLGPERACDRAPLRRGRRHRRCGCDRRGAAAAAGRGGRAIGGGRHPLHVRHDRRSQGRRADARQSRRRARRPRSASSTSPRPTRSSACCRSSTRWRRWPTCCCRSRSARASCFSTPSARRRSLAALQSRGHHDLRVRAAVLLSDPPARHCGGRQARRARPRSTSRADRD